MAHTICSKCGIRVHIDVKVFGKTEFIEEVFLNGRYYCVACARQIDPTVGVQKPNRDVPVVQVDELPVCRRGTLTSTKVENGDSFTFMKRTERMRKKGKLHTEVILQLRAKEEP